MLSWDDFRHVMMIADSGSFNEAAKALGINHATVPRRIKEIEHRAGKKLFESSDGTVSLTPAGEELAQIARRMERHVVSLGRRDEGAEHNGGGVVPLETVMSRSGLEFLTDMVEGKIPQPPMAVTLGFRLADVSEGRAAFEGLPEFRLYNPISTVHGGFAASLLDSALGCAIFSTLAKGETWTTLELKLNFVRPMSKDTGPVRAEGRVIHRGRTVATSEGGLKDRAGKLYAHATTTCMIFSAKG